MRSPSDPRTEAGKRLLAGMPWTTDAERDGWGRLILVIEAEATPDTELREAVRTVVQWVDNIAEWPMPPPLNEELRDLRAILERTER